QSSGAPDPRLAWRGKVVFGQRERLTRREAGGLLGGGLPCLEQPHGIGAEQRGDLEAERERISDPRCSGRSSLCLGGSVRSPLSGRIEHAIGHVLADTLRG